ncbi:MAG: DUF5615 family PIN-like protein [Phycisphaerales bacterium]|nr:DUF5615 family PIN-like protein [Phycisphaerales bacterium]
MKLLRDENLPHDLRHFLPGHDVFTVAYMGWKGLENGELMSAAAREDFDAMLTLDSGIPHQQNTSQLPLSLVLIHAPSNTLDDLRPLIPDLLHALGELKPRELIQIPKVL